MVGIVLAAMLGACSITPQQQANSHKYDPNYEAYYRSQRESSYRVPGQSGRDYYGYQPQGPIAPAFRGQEKPSERDVLVTSLEGRVSDLESQLQQVATSNSELRVQLQHAIVVAEAAKDMAATLLGRLNEGGSVPAAEHRPYVEQLPTRARKVSSKQHEATIPRSTDPLAKAFAYSDNSDASAEPEMLGGEEKYQAIYDVVISAKDRSDLDKIDVFLSSHGIDDRFKAGKVRKIFLGSFSSASSAAERRQAIKSKTGLVPEVIRRLVAKSA
jgi:hypothetical protein